VDAGSGVGTERSRVISTVRSNAPGEGFAIYLDRMRRSNNLTRGSSRGCSERAARNAAAPNPYSGSANVSSAEPDGIVRYWRPLSM
jgi:hypothetical protein